MPASTPEARTAKEQSELVIALAPHVEDFLGELFGIAKEVEALQSRHNALAPFFAFKRKFIQKRAISGVTKEQAEAIDGPGLGRELEAIFGEPLTEQSFFAHVSAWLENERNAWNRSRLPHAMPPGPRCPKPDERSITAMFLFKVAHKLDLLHLVPVESRGGERNRQTCACPKKTGAAAKGSI